MAENCLLGWLLNVVKPGGEKQPNVKYGDAKGYAVYDAVFGLGREGPVELPYPPHDLETARALRAIGLEEGAGNTLHEIRLEYGGHSYQVVRIVVTSEKQ